MITSYDAKRQEARVHARVFHGRDGVTLPGGEAVVFNEDTDWIRVAYLTLAPLLGTATGQARGGRLAGADRPEELAEFLRLVGPAERDEALERRRDRPVLGGG